jgi:hypothetical protein
MPDGGGDCRHRPFATAIRCQLWKDHGRLDNEVDRINGSAPSGAMRRLRKTELVARGIPNFYENDLRITEECQLPTWVIGSRRPRHGMAAACAEYRSGGPAETIDQFIKEIEAQMRGRDKHDASQRMP